MFCPECGKDVGTGGDFCTNCGAKIESSESTLLSVSTGNKRNFPALIGGVLLIISFFLPWTEHITRDEFGHKYHLGFVIMNDELMRMVNLSIGDEGISVVFTKQKLILLIISGWFVPIGGAITAYFSYTRNKNTLRAMIFTVIDSLIVAVLLLNSNAYIGRHMLKLQLGIGILFMLAGIICITISIIKSSFDRKLKR